MCDIIVSIQVDSIHKLSINYYAANLQCFSGTEHVLVFFFFGLQAQCDLMILVHGQESYASE
jgi:hypothetical protein